MQATESKMKMGMKNGSKDLGYIKGGTNDFIIWHWCSYFWNMESTWDINTKKTEKPAEDSEKGLWE